LCTFLCLWACVWGLRTFSSVKHTLKFHWRYSSLRARFVFVCMCLGFKHFFFSKVLSMNFIGVYVFVHVFVFCVYVFVHVFVFCVFACLCGRSTFFFLHLKTYRELHWRYLCLCAYVCECARLYRLVCLRDHFIIVFAAFLLLFLQ
jgi:hypothetical protein